MAAAAPRRIVRGGRTGLGVTGLWGGAWLRQGKTNGAAAQPHETSQLSSAPCTHRGLGRVCGEPWLSSHSPRPTWGHRQGQHTCRHPPQCPACGLCPMWCPIPPQGPLCCGSGLPWAPRCLAPASHAAPGLRAVLQGGAEGGFSGGVQWGGAPTARHAQSPLGAVTLMATPQGGTAVPRGSPRSRALHGEGPPRVAHHPPLPGPGWGRGGTQPELTAGLRSTRGLAGARAQLAAPTRCDERPVLSRRVGVGGLGVSGCGDGATTPQRGRVGTTGERRRNGKAPTAPIRTGKGSRSEVLCNQKQLWEGGTKPRGEKERGCGARRGMGRPQPRASRCPCSRAQQRGRQGGGRRLHRPPRRRAGRDGRSAQEKGSRGGGPSMRSLLPPRIPASPHRFPSSTALRRAPLAAPSPAQGRVPQSAAGWGARRGGGGDGDGAGGPRRGRGRRAGAER